MPIFIVRVVGIQCIFQLTFLQVDEYHDFENHLTKRSGSEYLRAQQDGHYNQDCSEYEAACPDSIFGVRLAPSFVEP